MTVDSFVIGAGERYDFVVNAGQEISSYWIRLHGLMDCAPKKVFQAAIFRYNGAPETEPEETLTYENTNRAGRVRLALNYCRSVFVSQLLVCFFKDIESS